MNFENTVKTLGAYANEEYPVTSMYLKLGPRERENFSYTIKLKSMAKDLRDDVAGRGLGKEAMESVESDILKITAFIDNPDNVNECRGIAVFSSSKAGLWEVMKLPAIYRSQLVIDSSPLLGQLLKIDDEYRHIVTIVIDRKKARIFSIGRNGANEMLDYLYPSAARTTKFHSPEGKFQSRVAAGTAAGSLSQSFGEYGFNRLIENEVHQHYKYVAQKVLDYYRESKFHWLVIGGTDENISEFSHHLHSSLKDKVAGTISIDMEKVRPSPITEATLDAVDSARKEKQKKLVDEFTQKLATGYAVNGIKSVWKALEYGQVSVLLAAEGYTEPGFICPDSGFLRAEDKDKCPEGAPHIPVQDAVDRTVQAAFGQGGEVELLSDEELKKAVRGVGAILRFTLS